MALGNNDENYMPPVSTRRMMQDLAILPIWYAQPGSVVLAPSAYNADYLKEMQRLFPISAKLVTEPELPDYAEAQIMPWGWNPALRKYLLKHGIVERKLPTVEHLQDLRTLSSRGTAFTILPAFEEEEDCCGSSSWLTSVEHCRDFVEQCNPAVLKAPWSGSGKGLNWCKGKFTDSISGWCERVLKEQGAVVGEPVFNEVENFALEFYSDGNGSLLFVGYSLFNTMTNGAYRGNMLASADQIEMWLADYVPLLTIIRVREKLQKLLSELYGSYYVGYLGVDLMICSDEKNRKYFVHPCVEINMRMTMGIVAHLFREKFLAPGKLGRFGMEYYTSNDDLQAIHKEEQEQNPLVIEKGRLVSGYLSLVPVTPKSHYRTYVKVNKQ